MSSFIVTVDTEGDNLWNWKQGDEITTENSKYIPRFQTLCEKYGVKPVYLVNYEMASDENFMKYLKQKSIEEKCEIGMHLHAWNTPEKFILENKYPGNPYITEYPYEVMYQKMKFMTDLLEEKTDQKMKVHRAGRWASNDTMFQVLKELGYLVDCSLVSQMDLSLLPGRSIDCGFDYRKIPNCCFEIQPGLLEVPMTTAKLHHFQGSKLLSRAKHLIIGERLWMRTATSSDINLIKVLKKKIYNNEEYIEFMIHSSELMAGGSPYFSTEEDIEKHYCMLEKIFFIAAERCETLTLSEFEKLYRSNVSLAQR